MEVRIVLQILAVIFLEFIIECASCENVDWRKARDAHKPVVLTTTKMSRLASRSDIKLFKKELGPLLHVRVSDTKSHKKVQQHIVSRLEGLNWSIEKDKFIDTTPFGDKTFTNIIATHNPSARRRLTLACHYDSKYFKDFKFIGATDSAVPCAMLLDLARILNESLWKNYLDGASCHSAKDESCEKAIKKPEDDLTLQLLFFDGEEAFVEWTEIDSIYGARHLAKKYEKSKHPRDTNPDTNMLHTIEALVLLDLIGTRGSQFWSYWKNTEPMFNHFRKIEKKLNKIKLLKKPHGSRVYFQDQMNLYAGIEDDHIPFLRKGVPVVHLIASPFPTEWHTKHDNEKCIDFDTVNDLNVILRQFVVEYLHLSV